MLLALEIKNFKSARDLPIKLAPLTVLTGLNGSGKSTVLQALALIKQTLDLKDDEKSLILQGPLIRLGRSEDIQYEGAKTDDIQFSIKTTLSELHFLAKAKHGADTLELRLTGDSTIVRAELSVGFQFIQADRMTPALQYEQASTPDQILGWLGCGGEFTVDFLQRNGDKHVSSSRKCPLSEIEALKELIVQAAPTPSLQDQTAGWLQQLSPGIKISANPVDISETTSLRFQYTGTKIDSLSRNHKPSHVGFGLTYCLPIIVACLAAPPGALLLLENPEAHLHPRGQAALGRLLAKSAADGVQIVVETHSDHVLNGIRVAVKQKEIAADDVAIHYFTRETESGESSIDSPRILPDGQMDRWPEGFFDQWDQSLDELLS